MNEKPLAEQTAEQIRARFEWEKVHAPKTWRPKYNGEELVGFYGGRTTKKGPFGQYDVIIVHVPARGAFMVSGTMALQLVDASMIEVGAPMRLVWRGYVAIAEERKMKSFELFVVAGETVRAEALPEVRS